VDAYLDGRTPSPRVDAGAGPGRVGVSLDPALILGALVGIFNAAVYVLIRGHAGGRLPLVVGAAILGAWAGNTLGDRLGISLASIGDFRLVAATAGAWLGIAIVSVVAVLGPNERQA
jgi:uncharacterized membrane protein YeaQ/YmgE (transglycosylase-associated protein family)